MDIWRQLRNQATGKNDESPWSQQANYKYKYINRMKDEKMKVDIYQISKYGENNTNIFNRIIVTLLQQFQRWC